MLKKLIAIFFCTALIFQNSGIFLVFAGYNLNKNYIAKNLCENKYKPSMRCNGKCFLAKKLREEEKQQKSPASGNQKMSAEMQFFFADNKLELSFFADNTNSSVYNIFNDLQTVQLPSFIFRPPNA